MCGREALRPVEIEEPPKPVSNAIRKESTGIFLMDRQIGIMYIDRQFDSWIDTQVHKWIRLIDKYVVSTQRDR